MTVPHPIDTLGDPVVERTLQKLVETAGRLVSNRSVPGSGVTAPYGTIDDTGKVELSTETMTKTGAMASTKPPETSRVPDRKIREMPMRKVPRVFDVQKNSLIKKNITGVPDTGM